MGKIKKSKKLLKGIEIFLAVFLIVCVSGYKLMNSRTYQIAGELISKVENDEKAVYLTFDDGPTEETNNILKVLNELDVKATFFLIGSNIENNKEYAKAIVDAGHGIGNHTYSHERMIFKSPSFVKDEIDKTNELIKSLGYDKEILFRPPFGKKIITLPMYLNKINQSTIMWNIEPESYPEVSKSSESIAKHVLDNIDNGSIILLHPMNDKSGEILDSIKLIVKELKEEGYTFKVFN